MDGAFGAMVSFEITGDYQVAKRMVESTKLFKLAVSLGAVESLIEQPAAMSHASYDRADRLAHGLSDGLVRLSVGLEAFDDLRADLIKRSPPRLTVRPSAGTMPSASTSTGQASANLFPRRCQCPTISLWTLAKSPSSLVGLKLPPEAAQGPFRPHLGY